MEALFELLFRASVSLIVLYALYWFLLRESTHFKANRFFLLLSLMTSLVIAAIPVQYQVNVQAAANETVAEFAGVFNHNIENTNSNSIKENISLASVLFLIYLTGASLVLLRILIQCRKPILIISNSKPKKINDCLIHENKVFNSPFSFFNRILINPEYFKQDEIDDILTHEKVHIHERHWIDLFIIELLTVFFWFNPFIWLFERAIKQNHEYLADEGVLTRGHSPVRYQALLINRLMGTQVIGLANHFSSSLGPTRFKMMTKEKTAKRKLFRMIWGIPVLAILLVAFAEPDYKQETKITKSEALVSSINNADNILITGKVINEDGINMPGTSIILKGSTTGTVVDKDGTFELNVPKSEKMALVISYVGYKTIVEKINPSDKKVHFNFKLQKGVISIGSKSMFLDGDVPPPPPPPVPEMSNSDKPVFFIVEEIPHYPNGRYGLGQYVKKKTAELKSKFGKNLKGKATLGFTVNAKGEVTNIQILNKSNDIAAKAAKTIAHEMENWKPGSQRGKNVPVDFAMELEF
ncbi:MAG: carboxypeptidase-like regulatory domain-containing protein [Labilibaculum sp.]|nr:M56 family metallopeptidase [Labilibaculum sp.]MBI9059236.1 carboxypeptidase-like regulatory domain-containing protein [Labilibaculum sp.]